jgi:hypothetical protein
LRCNGIARTSILKWSWCENRAVTWVTTYIITSIPSTALAKSGMIVTKLASLHDSSHLRSSSRLHSSSRLLRPTIVAPSL